MSPRDALHEPHGLERNVLLDELPTPSLILDLDRLERNCDRMIRRAAELGVRLRPHMKTAKSADVGRLATRDRAVGVTVSTVAEAQYFAQAGFRDITYAVGIAGHKVGPLAALQRDTGARISLLADTVAAVQDAARHAEAAGEQLALFLEIDSGGGRGGVAVDGPELPALGQAVRASPWLSLAGVLTHAGQSYGASGIEEIRQIAEQERVAVTRCGGSSARARPGGARGERGLDADGAPRSLAGRRHRHAARGVHAVRSGPGRARQLRCGRHRRLGAGDGDRAQSAGRTDADRCGSARAVEGCEREPGRTAGGVRARVSGHGRAAGGGPRRGGRAPGAWAGGRTREAAAGSSRAIRSAVECGCCPTTPASWRRRTTGIIWCEEPTCGWRVSGRRRADGE